MKAAVHRYTTEQLRAIKSPARSDVLTTLLAHDKGSVREIAEWTGRETTSLYPHVRALLAAGLIQVAEIRGTKRRKEQVYEPVAERFDRSLPDDDPEFRRAFADSVLSSMTNVQSKVSAAAEANHANGLFVGTLNAFLDPEALEELKNALDAICRRGRALNSPTTGLRISLVVAMAPVGEKESSA